MKGNSGHVQTVSIIDTISELAGGGAGGGGRRLGGGVGVGGVRPRLGRSQSPGPPSNPLSLQRAPPPPLPRLPRMAGLLGSATSGHLTTSISVNSLHSLPSYSFSDLRSAPAPPHQQRPGILTEHSGERKKRRGRRGRQQGGSRGHSETPDWIRELFLWARKGDLERLVRSSFFTFILFSINMVFCSVRHSWISYPWLSHKQQKRKSSFRFGGFVKSSSGADGNFVKSLRG